MYVCVSCAEASEGKAGLVLALDGFGTPRGARDGGRVEVPSKERIQGYRGKLGDCITWV